MTAFTMKKDYRKEEREVKSQWALAQRTLHGWYPKEAVNIFPEKGSYSQSKPREELR
ncbi:hypothetical protein BRARA_J02688 [Brassica rapa]|uniref:Uncharacterized protein n=1 Tax=Brassica campestris TaxID=3711 RepID=A0A397XWF7_BRACM|nr:hypothetical protein BRARA_J02688 [Brassica rapa]